jgi:endonuclease G
MDALPLADETHKVPSGYWKVVVKNNSVVGFIMEQDTERSKNECEAIIPLSEIEQRSELELFPQKTLSDGEISIVGCE